MAFADDSIRKDRPILGTQDSAHSGNQTYAELEQRCRRALRDRPADAEALLALGEAHLNRGDDLEVVRLWEQAIHTDEGCLPAYRRLGVLYYHLGRDNEAAALFSELARRDPQSPDARHLASLGAGSAAPPRAPDEYVRALFDMHAPTFDEVLVKYLDYRSPQVIGSALRRIVGCGYAQYDVLDAGCGTGLCAEQIKSWCRTLVGVDLSVGMIERARTRNLYDELVIAELGAFVEEHPLRFDVIVAADTLIYFGLLDAVLLSAARALRPAGLILFTVEALADEVDIPYRLEVHGRYAHHRHYLCNALRGAGFELVELRSEVARLEREKPVNGYLVVARKPDGASA